MKVDLIICGVGGQGIISIAAVIGRAALSAGLSIKQSEIHGMAQRGGSVHSHLRLSSESIASDVIPRGGADIILSLEPMEALRYLPYLKAQGWLISNQTTVPNIPNYPVIEDIYTEIRRIGNHHLFDGDIVAKDCGSPRSVNMAMLGSASAHIDLPVATFEEAVRRQFERKGERVVDLNLKVFHAARALAEQLSTS